MSEQTISYLDNLPEEINLTVNPGDFLKFHVIALSGLNASKINVEVKENGYFEGVIADLAAWSGHIAVNVNLVGEGAECSWHLASLSSGNDRKTFETSVIHSVNNTTALMSDYGITRDNSKIVFSGNSVIEKDASKSKTRQEAKIIVFDETSDGIASPALIIKNNDVVASHAAVVGRLNEDHLFYLRSRGLNEEEAKRIIALGYLKPVERFFSDEDKKQLDEAIERRISDD